MSRIANKGERAEGRVAEFAAETIHVRAVEAHVTIAVVTVGSWQEVHTQMTVVK